MKKHRPTLATTSVAVILLSGIPTMAAAEVLPGLDAIDTSLPACSFNQRLVLDIESPMTEERALAFIGLEGPSERLELARTQEMVRATCS